MRIARLGIQSAVVFARKANAGIGRIELGRRRVVGRGHDLTAVLAQPFFDFAFVVERGLGRDRLTEVIVGESFEIGAEWRQRQRSGRVARGEFRGEQSGQKYQDGSRLNPDSVRAGCEAS